MISLIQTLPHKSNDEEFMLNLYLEYKNLMYSTAHKYVSNFQEMDDIIQDCLVSLYEKIDTLRPMPEKVLAGYIVSTVRNTAINKLKADEYEKQHATDYTEENIASQKNAVPLETLFIMSERHYSLLRVWPKLSEENRILLEGKYILGYTDQELAQKLKCKASSIRMKLTRARRAALLLLSKDKGSEKKDQT